MTVLQMVVLVLVALVVLRIGLIVQLQDIALSYLKRNVVEAKNDAKRFSVAALELITGEVEKSLQRNYVVMTMQHALSLSKWRLGEFYPERCFCYPFHKAADVG